MKQTFYERIYMKTEFSKFSCSTRNFSTYLQVVFSQGFCSNSTKRGMCIRVINVAKQANFCHKTISGFDFTRRLNLPL